nr:BV-like protein [Cotesia vestalis bracovirus]
MLANKIVILLWISIFSVSWIQATPDGKEAKGLSLSEDYARWFRQKYFQAITDEDRSSNDSVSRSTTSTVSNTLSDEGSGQEDIFTDDGSGLPASTSEDDFSEVTSPLPVTTTEDFTFEGPASTSVVIKNDSKKIEEADQHSLCVIIIVVSVSAVILLLILLTVIKIYCRCCKVRQEEHAAKEPFIRFSKNTCTANTYRVVFNSQYKN